MKLKLETMRFIMKQKHLIKRSPNSKDSSYSKQMEQFRYVMWQQLQKLIKNDF